MKLSFFNPWKTFGSYFGREFQYQTSKVKGSDKLLVTYVRDAKTNATIAKAYGNSEESSVTNVVELIKQSGKDSVWNALENGEPIVPKAAPREPIAQKLGIEGKRVDWRDGAQHSYRAQKRIVGEKLELNENEIVKDKKPRNFVAKHARQLQKGGPMKDKKNDYQRSPKHKKRAEREE